MLFLFLLCWLQALPGKVAEAEDVPDFYGRSREGWFWYKDPPAEPDLKPVKQGKRPERPTVRELDSYSLEELWNMYPDDFQELLNHTQKKAVQYPTEDNVLRYLAIQDVARRKALAYTGTAMLVSQKYSDRFNVGQVYPTAQPGVVARLQMQQEEIARTIKEGRGDHALLFFVNPSCGFCSKQRQILEFFVEKYNWPVRTIDISQNSSAAARFNITVTPTLLLVKRGQEASMPISTGVIALTELEQKLFRAVRYLRGERRGENYLMYDFQKDSPLDPQATLNKGVQPWKK
jgi:conjugal transfer pilus assembly protein TraF